MSYLLMVDTETGGINPDVHALLSIGAVVFDMDLVTHSSIEIFINPPSDLIVTPEALKVNKLNLAKLKEEGLSEPDGILLFEDFVRRYRNGVTYPILCGWNTHFDIGDEVHPGFLLRLYQRHRQKWNFGWRQLDVADLWVYAQLFQERTVNFGGLREATLSMLNKVPEHGALSDATLTLELLTRFLKE